VLEQLKKEKKITSWGKEGGARSYERKQKGGGKKGGLLALIETVNRFETPKRGELASGEKKKKLGEEYTRRKELQGMQRYGKGIRLKKQLVD